MPRRPKGRYASTQKLVKVMSRALGSVGKGKRKYKKGKGKTVSRSSKTINRGLGVRVPRTVFIPSAVYQTFTNTFLVRIAAESVKHDRSPDPITSVRSKNRGTYTISANNPRNITPNDSTNTVQCRGWDQMAFQYEKFTVVSSTCSARPCGPMMKMSDSMAAQRLRRKLRSDAYAYANPVTVNTSDSVNAGMTPAQRLNAFHTHNTHSIDKPGHAGEIGQADNRQAGKFCDAGSQWYAIYGGQDETLASTGQDMSYANVVEQPLFFSKPQWLRDDILSSPAVYRNYSLHRDLKTKPSDFSHQTTGNEHFNQPEKFHFVLTARYNQTSTEEAGGLQDPTAEWFAYPDIQYLVTVTYRVKFTIPKQQLRSMEASEILKFSHDPDKDPDTEPGFSHVKKAGARRGKVRYSDIGTTHNPGTNQNVRNLEGGTMGSWNETAVPRSVFGNTVGPTQMSSGAVDLAVRTLGNVVGMATDHQ